MNKFIATGRLTRDPEIRVTKDGKGVATYTLAVDRRYKEGEVTADFFNCVSFGKQAEFIEKYLKKGTKILLTGRVENDSYTNKDGQKVNTTKIIGEDIEFAESKKTEAKPEPAPEMYVPDDISLPFQ